VKIVVLAGGGQRSFDSIATSITQIFDFENGAGGNGGKLILDPASGEPAHEDGGDQ
jgi:hypothetical protein